jgi:hypothetical protein
MGPVEGLVFNNEIIQIRVPQLKSYSSAPNHPNPRGPVKELFFST